MKDQPIKINELENTAQKIVGGRIVRENSKNPGSFKLEPMKLFSRIYGPRVTVDTINETVYVNNPSYLFKANRLAENLVNETGNHWTIDENPPKEKKQTRKEKNFWKYHP